MKKFLAIAIAFMVTLSVTSGLTLASSLKTVATVTSSVKAGTYTNFFGVKLGTSTSGATIYYTTNGATPTTGSTKCTGIVEVYNSETLKAIAVKSGMTTSKTASYVYKLNLPVSSSCTPGTYTAARSVVLKTTISGATIYYTTDGSSPTTNSTKYTKAFSVSKTETVNAFAVKSGIASKVISFAYTINIPLNLSGSIIYDGSSALAPLINLAAPMFTKLYPKVTIPAAGTNGSGTGVQEALSGAISIGGSDVLATSFVDAITANKLIDHQICIIGFAAVIDKNLNIKNLTTAQLKAVYTGKDSSGKVINYWSDVDPSFPHTAITVVVRASGSGTRVVFDSAALGGATVRSDSAVITGTSSGNVESVVNTTPGAIGYLALSYTISSAGTNVLPISLNGVAPTYANIYSGKYNIIGIEHIYTDGKPNATVQAFIDYMTSSAFASTITSNGYGLLSSMQQ